MKTSDANRVVVVGGGFAGTSAARELAHHHIPTTIIDANGFQTFQPMLYQAATGLIALEDIEYPLSKIDGVTVVKDTVTTIDLVAGTVGLAGGTPVAADYVVLATGARVNFLGVQGAAEHTIPLYTATDARAIKTRLQQAVQAQQDLHIVVVGGGATGVEVSGAISDVLDEVLPRTFPDFRRERVSVSLVDGSPTLLTHMSAKSQAYAQEVLSHHGVNFHLGRRVTEVDATTVHLDDGTVLSSDLTIWAGGLSASTPEVSPAPPRDHSGRVVISADLRIAGQERAYCIGDTSADADQPLPQLGSVAKQQGIAAAHNIRRQIHGHTPHKFDYRDLGDMAMIRHDAAAVEVGPHHQQVDGRLAYLMWLGLHAYLLPGGDHRFDAVRTWVHERVTGTSPFLVDGPVPPVTGGRP